MSATVKLAPVQAAYDDLLKRSLSKVSCDLARLIYLASTRDYNTGAYHHDGLASRFRPDAASCANITWYLRSPSLSSNPLRNSSKSSDNPRVKTAIFHHSLSATVLPGEPASTPQRWSCSSRRTPSPRELSCRRWS